MNIIKLIRSRLETNDKIVLKQTIFSFIVKGGAFLVSFLSTPFYIAYFTDSAILGIWFTILSVVSWTLNFDFGIGNGIRNRLVNDLTKGDKDSARRTVSSGVFSLGIVSVFLFVIGSMLILTLNLNRLFNLPESLINHSTLRSATLFAFWAIAIRFFLTCINSIYYALQKSSVNNLLALIVSVLQLIVVCFFHFENKEFALVFLACSLILTSNIPIIVAGFFAFKGQLKDCFPSIRFLDKTAINSILKIGVTFFYCQILFMLLMNTNEYLITYFYGSESTYEYSLYNKVLSVFSMLVALAVTPVWSVITKAMAENNYSWISKLLSRFKYLVLLVLLLYVVVVLLLQPLMDLWLGQSSFPVSYKKSIPLALFGTVYSYSAILSAVVCGLGRMKIQMIMYTIGLVLKVSVIVLFASVFNSWTLIIWINVSVFLVYNIVQLADLHYFMNNHSVGLINTRL